MFYSDGYTEVFNNEDEMFGDGRLRSCVARNAHLPPSELIRVIDNEILEFLGESQHGDDRTLVVLRVT